VSPQPGADVDQVAAPAELWAELRRALAPKPASAEPPPDGPAHTIELARFLGAPPAAAVPVVAAAPPPVEPAFAAAGGPPEAAGLPELPPGMHEVLAQLRVAERASFDALPPWRKEWFLRPHERGLNRIILAEYRTKLAALAASPGPPPTGPPRGARRIA
jgi:hypothetical protein